MAEHFFRELQGAEATALAELNPMVADMDAAIAGLTCLRDKYVGRALDPMSEEGLIASSLFHASVMRFAGCFDQTDKKWKLDADAIFGTDGAERESFNSLYDVRDAFVAHRFGALRQAVVGIAMTPSGRRFKSEHNIIYQYPDRNEIVTALAIMAKARTALTDLYKQASEDAAERLKAMTRAEIEALPVAQLFRDIRIDEIRLTRAKFAASRAGRNDGEHITVEESEELGSQSDKPAG